MKKQSLAIAPIAFAVILNLAGCTQSKTAAPETKPQTFRQYIASPGGPRLISILQAGKVTETLEAQYSDLIAPYAEVSGIRIVEGEKITRGIEIELQGVEAKNLKAKSEDHVTAALGLEEAQKLSAAIQVQADYLTKAASAPPQHDETMQWKSEDGLRAKAFIGDGQQKFSLGSDDSSSAYVSLTRAQALDFKQAVDAAINLTAK